PGWPGAARIRPACRRGPLRSACDCSTGWWRRTTRDSARSDPHVVRGGAGAALVAGVGDAARLDQQQLHLVFGAGLVLNAPRHDEHLAGRDPDCAVAEINAQFAVDDDEGLVGVRMAVPNEVALQLHDLELVVVHLRDDLRLPLFAEQAELL